MPHSLDTAKEMAPQINGDSPSSAFISHLISYPIISDSISTFKSNPYGQKSLDITTASYEKFGKPILPYFSKPYQYVSPYVAKVDSIGDHTLSTIDEKFPVVKKPTGELYSEGRDFVSWPLKKGNEGKDYVLSTYEKESKKTKEEGIIGYGKAVVSTSFIVGSDALAWLSEILRRKKAEAKEVTNEKLAN